MKNFYSGNKFIVICKCLIRILITPKFESSYWSKYQLFFLIEIKKTRFSYRKNKKITLELKDTSGDGRARAYSPFSPSVMLGLTTTPLSQNRNASGSIAPSTGSPHHTPSKSEGYLSQNSAPHINQVFGNQSSSAPNLAGINEHRTPPGHKRSVSELPRRSPGRAGGSSSPRTSGLVNSASLTLPSPRKGASNLQRVGGSPSSPKSQLEKEIPRTSTLEEKGT